MSLYTSLLTAGTNNHEETSENANAFATDFVSEGVIGTITNTSGVAPATGAFAVNAQSTPDMTVAVSSGVAYVTATPASQNSQTLRVRNSASTNVTISSNTSGSTKYDWVYIKVDGTKAANPALNADDVATLVTSRSSSSSSDDGTPPTYGYPIAVVTVANSATSITNANITDKRVTATSTQPSSLTNAGLSTAAGELGGAWQSWTPTLTNLTLGNGTLIAKYTQVGKKINFRFTFILGSTSAVGTSPSFTLPVTMASYGQSGTAEAPIARVNYEDTGLSAYVGVARVSSTGTSASLYVQTTSGSYTSLAGVSSIKPHTWGTGDSIIVAGDYEAS